jgi:hypothetical protein
MRRCLLKERKRPNFATRGLPMALDVLVSILLATLISYFSLRRRGGAWRTAAVCVATAIFVVAFAVAIVFTLDTLMPTEYYSPTLMFARAAIVGAGFLGAIIGSILGVMLARQTRRRAGNSKGGTDPRGAFS